MKQSLRKSLGFLKDLSFVGLASRAFETDSVRL